MPRKTAAPAEAQPLQPLTALQRQAAALLADGATDERVAAELSVPLAWVQDLQDSLPVAAEVVRHQWRRYQAHGQRIRCLVEKALDVVEEELEQRPSPDLAVALLRSLKVEAPARPLLSAQDLLRAECSKDAEATLRQQEAERGLGWGYIGETERSEAAHRLYQERAPQRLSAPADPEVAA